MENRQLTAIMFTDIIGYTSLMTEDEKRTISLVDKSISIVKPLVQQYQGKVIKEIGDGTLSSFPSVVNAVKCAVTIQTKTSNITAFKLRIGIHLGDVVIRDHDIFGSGVNVASRLEALALPGTIFISGQVYDQLQNIAGINPEYVGKKKLKNVKSAIDIYKIGLNAELDSKTEDEEIIIEDYFEDRKKSLVIFPFKDLSPEKDINNISQHLCEEITMELSGVSNLKVISSTSASVLIESAKGIRELCDDFNIDYVLDGSIKKSDQILRISTQLIEGIKDKQIWSSKYKGSMNDISEFQKEISRSISEQLKLTSSLKTKKQKTQAKIEGLSVLEYSHKARLDIFSNNKIQLDKAIQILHEGIDIYGDCLILYALLGIAYYQYLHSGYSTESTCLHQMESCSEKLTQIDPESSQAILIKGVIAYHKGELVEAGSLLNRSYKLNKNDPLSIYFLLLLCRSVGEIKLAKTLSTQLAEHDPLLAVSQILPALIFYFDGKFQKAYDIGKNVLLQFNDHPMVLFYMALFAESISLRKKAIEYFESNYNLNEDNPLAGLGLLFRYALSKDQEYVMNGAEKYFPFVETGNAELSIWMADIFCLVGDKREAIKWITSAFEKGFTNYSYFNKVDPYLGIIREEKAFNDILKEIKSKNPR